MATKTLTLDPLYPDGSPAIGTRISVSVDRDVAIVGSGVIARKGAVQDYTIPLDGTFPIIQVTPNDDPSLQAWSQGYALIVEAEPTPAGGISGGPWTVTVTSADTSQVRLSDLGPAQPVPPQAVDAGTLLANSQAAALAAFAAAQDAQDAAALVGAPAGAAIDAHLGGDATGILAASGPYNALTPDVLNLIQGSGAFGALKATMEAVNNGATMHAAVQVLSDSTGVGPTFWPRLFAQWIADQCPDTTVRVRDWDFNNGTPDPGQNTRYKPTETIQTGTDDIPSQRCSSTKEQCAQYPATGDEITEIDFAVKFRPTSWPPTGAQTLISKTGAAGNIGFHFYVDSTVATDGPCLRISTDGSTFTTYRPNGGFTATQGEWTWLRVTCDLVAAEIKFFSSSDGTGAPASWVQIGTTTAVSPQYTALHTATGQDWCAGGAQAGTVDSPATGSQFFDGDLAEIWVRDSIDGPTLLPVSPHDWIAFGPPSYSGGSLIDVVVGAWGTKGITTLGTSPVRELMTPMLPTVLTIFNDSHNDADRCGPTYLALWDAWLTAVLDRLPVTSVAVTGQNPRTPPAGSRVGHDLRHAQLAAWAANNRATYLDVYAAFLADPRWDGTNTSVLMNADQLGVHPSDLGMAECWLPVVTRATETGA